MHRTPNLLFAEAVVLGLPITLLFAGAVPLLFVAVVAVLATPSLEGAWFAAQLICGAYALLQYWRLAIKTARGERVPFGRAAWSGAVCALVAGFFVITWSGKAVPAVLVVLAAAVGAGHFLSIQRAMQVAGAHAREHDGA